MPDPLPRRRDAATTRQAILDSARQAFARLGYDGAGVREIAAGAGVTAMLVNRYFGSKENLFAEVVADVMARPVILTPENLRDPDLGAVIADSLVNITASADTPLEGFQIMLRSAASDRAAAIARDQIEKHYQARLAAALPGENADLRAGVIFALVTGLQALRQMMGLKALAGADPVELKAILTPLLRQLVKNSS